MKACGYGKRQTWNHGNAHMHWHIHEHACLCSHPYICACATLYMSQDKSNKELSWVVPITNGVHRKTYIHVPKVRELISHDANQNAYFPTSQGVREGKVKVTPREWSCLWLNQTAGRDGRRTGVSPRPDKGKGMTVPSAQYRESWQARCDSDAGHSLNTCVVSAFWQVGTPRLRTDGEGEGQGRKKKERKRKKESEIDR